MRLSMNRFRQLLYLSEKCNFSTLVQKTGDQAENLAKSLRDFEKRGFVELLRKSLPGSLGYDIHWTLTSKGFHLVNMFRGSYGCFSNPQRRRPSPSVRAH